MIFNERTLSLLLGIPLFKTVPLSVKVKNWKKSPLLQTTKKFHAFTKQKTVNFNYLQSQRQEPNDLLTSVKKSPTVFGAF